MPDVLSEGMDLSLIETGIPGLEVTTIVPDRFYKHRVHVSFNKEPFDDAVCREGWGYDRNGYPITKKNPVLKLKKGTLHTVDWSKPIRSSIRKDSLKVVADFPDMNLVAVMFINNHFGAPIWVDRTTGKAVDRQLEVENTPLRRHQAIAVGRGGDTVRRVNYTASLNSDEALIELTYTDGIVTEVAVVEPNKTP